MEDCGWLGRRVSRGVLLGVALLILVALVAASGTSAADGKTFTVDSIGNGADATINSVCADMAGACSLRAAIQESNASVGSKDTIAFNIPAPHLIVLPALAADSFPFVTDAVVIDGETQPHYAGTPLVEIDAGGRGAFGLLVIGDDSAGTEIRGIAIYGGDSGSDNAIDFDNPGSNFVERNFIGTDASGTTTKGRGGVAFRRGSSGDGSVSMENTIADNVIAGTSGPAVLLDEASDNQVLRNLIGTDASGTVGISQQEGVGISLGAGSGRNLLADNVIADRNRGISILGPSPLNDHNRIERNLIGTDISGTVDLGNAVDGIAVDGIAPGTIIGGADPADRNVISGNGGSGVFVAIGTDTVIQGNLIGTDIKGTNDLGNGGGGIGLAQTNGLTLIRDNVISGNEGVGISGGPSDSGSVRIEGNLIGTNEQGTAKIGNARDGISIGGHLAESVIGGESDAQRNVISGNGGTGVVSIGPFSPGLQILNNYVGTDTTGTADLGNVVDGIRISSVDVVVGAPGSGNLVSGNGRHGVVLGSESTLVQGNRIGTNAQGTAPLGNGGTGITTMCCYRDIRIGGGASGEGNLVAGNGAWGIDFLGSGAGNALVVVEGNRIGTNDAGNAPIANGAGGVHIENTNAFLKLLSNVVSGNSGDGVDVEAVGFDTTELFGNRIGTNDAGTAAIPNTQNGVKLGRASLGGKIFVGGLPPSQRNIMSGNGANGIVVANGGHTIVGNFVGIDRDGTNAVPNTLSGLRVQVAPNEVHDNVFSGNGRDGVELLSGAQTLTRNLVGTGADGSSRLGNSRHGVSIEGSGASTQHVVGGQAGDGNTIAFNGGHGVLIHDAHVNFVERNEIFSNSGDGVAVVAGLPPRGAIRNKISENSISSNGGLGIDLQDDGVTPNDLGDGDGGSGFAARANFLQNFPVNLEVSADGTTVTGTLNSRPNTTYQIELFGNSAGVACDPSGNGEGEEFLTATDVITDGSGNATIPDVPLPEALPAGHFVTATATDGGAFPGNTSEFSQCATPPGEIVVRKETVPDGSPQPFAFSGAIYGHARRRAERGQDGRRGVVYGLRSGPCRVGRLGDPVPGSVRRQQRLDGPSRPWRDGNGKLPRGGWGDGDVHLHKHGAWPGDSAEDRLRSTSERQPGVRVRAPSGRIDDQRRHNARVEERNCGKRRSHSVHDDARLGHDVRALRDRHARLDDDARAARLRRLQRERRQQHSLHGLHRRAGGDEELRDRQQAAARGSRPDDRILEELELVLQGKSEARARPDAGEGRAQRNHDRYSDASRQRVESQHRAGLPESREIARQIDNRLGKEVSERPGLQHGRATLCGEAQPRRRCRKLSGSRERDQQRPGAARRHPLQRDDARQDEPSSVVAGELSGGHARSLQQERAVLMQCDGELPVN